MSASRITAAALFLITVGVGIAAALIQVEDTVQLTAVLEPAATVEVRAHEAGVVSAVHVRTGDSVRAGAPLLDLDASSLRFELERNDDQRRSMAAAGALADSTEVLRISGLVADSIEAATREDEARLQFSEAATEFGVRGPVDSLIAAHRTGTHVGLDRAYARVRSAQAALEQAGMTIRAAKLGRNTAARQREADIRRLEITARELQRRLDEHVLRAPYAGIIVSERPELLLGRTLASGDAVVTLAQRSSWKARGFLPIERATEVLVGNKAKLELPNSDVFRRVDLEGRVIHLGLEIGGASGTSAAVGTGVPILLEVDAPADDPEAATTLRAGLTVRVAVTTKVQSLGSLLWHSLAGGRR